MNLGEMLNELPAEILTMVQHLQRVSDQSSWRDSRRFFFTDIRGEFLAAGIFTDASFSARFSGSVWLSGFLTFLNEDCRYVFGRRGFYHGELLCVNSGKLLSEFLAAKNFIAATFFARFLVILWPRRFFFPQRVFVLQGFFLGEFLGENLRPILGEFMSAEIFTGARFSARPVGEFMPMAAENFTAVIFSARIFASFWLPRLLFSERFCPPRFSPLRVSPRESRPDSRRLFGRRDFYPGEFLGEFFTAEILVEMGEMSKKFSLGLT